MRASPFAVAVLALAVALPAQTKQAVLPVPAPANWSATEYPVGGPSGMRYQQWFAANQLQQTAGHPVRIVGLNFIAGLPGGQNGSQLDIEVTMANAPAQFSPVMDNNLASGTVVVVPRGPQTLASATPGTDPLVLNFKQYGTEFVWDGHSAVVIDFKMFSNGTVNGQLFNYDLQATFAAGNQMSRQWGFGSDPRSVSIAQFGQPGVGAAVRLMWDEGVSTSFGTGCAGAGNAVPVASTSGGYPLPGNALWTQELTNANSQVNAVLLLGDSNTMINGMPLPANLAAIGASNCNLLTSVLLTIGTTTIGGGAGAGVASIHTPVPPVSLYGQSVYSQWVVLDPLSANGILAMSQGLWHIFP